VNDAVVMSTPTGGVSDRRRPTPPAWHDDRRAQVVDPATLQRAWKQVKANRGAPGIDAMPLEDFPAFAREHWPALRQALLDGTYRPAPVRRVAIPKPGGRGERLLGIPTVLDRVIAQAIA
jgi:RNA-directed DNA polymerase